MIAIIGTSDRPCWLAEACKILLLLLKADRSYSCRQKSAYSNDTASAEI